MGSPHQDSVLIQQQSQQQHGQQQGQHLNQQQHQLQRPPHLPVKPQYFCPSSLTPAPVHQPQFKKGYGGVSSSRKTAQSSTSTGTRAYFLNKKFYLDLKGNTIKGPSIRQLFEDIKALGGSVEDFFSKEIDVVISGAPEWKLRNPSSSPQIVSPGTPASLPALVQSPWSPSSLTPSSAKPVQPRTRVETILERARQQSKGTSDVIENAAKWNIKVWALHKIQEVLEKIKTKYGPLRRHQQQHVPPVHTRSQSAENKAWPPPKPLRAPYLKFEVQNCEYRPVFHEFALNKFPKLYLNNGRPGASLFLMPDHQHAADGGAHDNHNEGTKKHRDVRNRKRGCSPSPADPPAKATPTLIKKNPKRQAGFCEICDVGDVISTGPPRRGRKPTSNPTTSLNSYNRPRPKCKKPKAPTPPPSDHDSDEDDIEDEEDEDLDEDEEEEEEGGICESDFSSDQDEANIDEDEDDLDEEEDDENDDDDDDDEVEDEEEEDEDESGDDDEDLDDELCIEPVRRSKRVMKTRHDAMANGQMNGDDLGSSLRSRNHSTCSENGLTPKRKPTRRRFSSRNDAVNGDEEISFSDPLAVGEDDNDRVFSHMNGNLTTAEKKKRKSSTEKFLEDNSEYYQIKVLPNKLRSSSSLDSNTAQIKEEVVAEEEDEEEGDSNGDHHRSNGRLHSNGTHSISQQKNLRRKSGDEHQSGDGQHGSAASPSRGSRNRRHSIPDDDSPERSLESRRLLRVDLERLKDEVIAQHSDLDHSDAEPMASAGTPMVRRNSRKSSRSSRPTTRNVSSSEVAQASSPSPKRRRTELDKLLEAGSSSFHFETARDATHRENGDHGDSQLPPLQVDISESSNLSVEDAAATEATTAVPERRAKMTRKRVLELKEEEGASDEAESEDEALKPLALRRRRKKKTPTPKKLARGRKKGLRGTKLLTRADLMKGPAYLAPKAEKELVVSSKQKDSKHKDLIKDYLPHDLFQELQVRLRNTSPEPIDVDQFLFSFETTPLYEPWFQTYTRQDQGNEIYYYPESSSLTLPYEMPVTTFYPKKDGPGTVVKKKVGNKFLEVPPPSSGSTSPQRSTPVRKAPPAPPIDLKPAVAPPVKPPGTQRKDSKASTDSSDSARSVALRRKQQQAILTRLAPALRGEFSRKSPRGHASTKALLNTQLPPATEPATEEPNDSVDVESIDDMEPLHFEDTVSNDEDSSGAYGSNDSKSTYPAHRRALIQESPAQFARLAGSLDSLLREEDPMLMTDTEAEDIPQSLRNRRKKLRRRSSSGKSISKQVCAEEPMDRLVASNVDPVLFECLEDEMPSVAIDEQRPGSDPMSLLETYEHCDSISKCVNSKWARRANSASSLSYPPHSPTKPATTPPAPTTKKPAAAEASPPPAPSTSSAVATKKKKSLLKQALLAGNDDASSEAESSVCDTASEISSTASESSSTTSTRKKKKKRNMTGFPNKPKKKKKKTATTTTTTAKATPKTATPPKKQGPKKAGPGRGRKAKAAAAVVEEPPDEEDEAPPAKAGGRRGRKKASPKKAVAVKKEVIVESVDEESSHSPPPKKKGRPKKVVPAVSGTAKKAATAAKGGKKAAHSPVKTRTTRQRS